VNRVEELVGDAGDGNVGDLELLLAKQVQQEIERPGVGIELDDEARAGAECGGWSLGKRHVSRVPPAE
jgi:hypothetical protein